MNKDGINSVRKCKLDQNVFRMILKYHLLRQLSLELFLSVDFLVKPSIALNFRKVESHGFILSGHSSEEMLEFTWEASLEDGFVDFPEFSGVILQQFIQILVSKQSTFIIGKVLSIEKDKENDCCGVHISCKGIFTLSKIEFRSSIICCAFTEKNAVFLHVRSIEIDNLEAEVLI